MLLANLLLKLRPLVADPETQFDAIVELLEKHDDFAEYEVARHYVAIAVEPWIEQRLASPDPIERVAAIRGIRQCFSRGRAAKQLRHLVKDANLRVRGAARRSMDELGIDDVALRDSRIREPAVRNRPGGWNPSGWLFGSGRRRSPPRAPAAVRAVLPKLVDRQALAKWLGYDDHDALVRFMRPGSDTGAPYVDFEIPKAKGGTRTISAPRAPLRKIQRQIHQQILAKVAAHDAAHGFVAGRSTVSNAVPHVGAVLLIKTDIQDFFPTIHYGRVRGLFRLLGYADEVASSLAALCTRRPVLERADEKAVIWPGLLPQGAPTSPAIANLLCRRLDARLSGFAARIDARYTRYADDLGFSFHDLDHAMSLDLGKLFWWIDQIIQQEGFREHPGKRQVLWPNRRQMITGIVINEKLSLPREARRRFRAILHNCKTQGIASQARGRDDFADYLRGWAAYAQMVDPKIGAAWVAEVDELLSSTP
jgi:RNA-directed DNA polymerase